jgi:hypothetical protein
MTMNIERKRSSAGSGPWIAAPLVALALLAVDAGAKSRHLAADNAVWRAECGTCHVAYPPALLPAAEWGRLMVSLDRHFGADAAVDAKAAAEIDAFQAANAGKAEGRTAAAEPRITTTGWFRKKHREVAAAVFRAASVKTPANCAACHPGAAAGNFDEHAVTIPRQ